VTEDKKSKTKIGDGTKFRGRQNQTEETGSPREGAKRCAEKMPIVLGGREVLKGGTMKIDSVKNGPTLLGEKGV